MAHEEQDGGGGEGDEADEVYGVKGRVAEEPGVGAQEFDEEAPQGVPDEVHQEEITGQQASGEAQGNP